MPRPSGPCKISRASVRCVEQVMPYLKSSLHIPELMGSLRREYMLNYIQIDLDAERRAARQHI
jgi:hypothetical protein